MKNPWIIPVVTLAVGAAGGYFSGKASPSSTAVTTGAGSAAQAQRSGRSTLAGDQDSKKGSRAKSVADAMNTPGHSARVKALIDFYATLTPDQIADEAKKLDNLPMNERIMASILLYGRWAEVDPNAAMASANTMGMAGMFVRGTILQSWASVDPENAAKYYAENPREFAMMGGFGGGPGGGQNGASTIAAEWAKQDPQAALAWASSLTGDDKARAMTSVIREMAVTDPKKAAEMAGSIDAADRGQAYDSIARRWGSSNFTEAEAWVHSLPADQQGAAMASAIAGLAQENPQLALTHAEAMADGDEKARAIRNSLDSLSKINPAAALAELGKLDAEAQQHSVESVISNYAVTDAKGAETYINTLEAGGLKDNAIGAYVRNNNTSDPASMMPLAAQITDERARDQAMGITYYKWAREDETAAKSYVENSTLPDNVKERLLNSRGGRGGPGGGNRRGR